MSFIIQPGTGGGGTNIPVADEGSQITAAVSSFNFTGSGVTATAVGNAVTVNVPGGGGSSLTISNKTGAYTVVAGDLGTIINCTSGTFTVSLTAAATLGSGFNCWVWNTSNTATDVITIDPNGSETIDGLTSLVLYRGEGMQIICDGTNWQTGDKKTMRGYSENFANSITRPVASGLNGTAIGNGSTASGTVSLAIHDGATASALRSIAIAGIASAAYSATLGYNSSGSSSQAVTGAGAMALGGSYASGTDSFAAAITNNTSTYGAKQANAIAIGRTALCNTSDGIAIGYLAQATASGGVAIGPQASSSQSNIAISCNGLRSIGATASSNGGCIAIGGNVTASAFSAVAIGQDAVAPDAGKLVFSPVRLASNGDAQTGIKVLAASTTNATPKALTTGDFGTGTAAYQLILPNNSAYAFTGTVVARQQAAGGTQSAAWKVEGLIRREGAANTTTLVASTVTAISNVPGWTLALSADTTNGGVAITGTGAAATNIYWVATVNTAEVTFG